MNSPSTAHETVIQLPVQAPRPGVQQSALVARLADTHGAAWVDETSIAAWAAQGGDRVVLFAGDAVRFPEGQDVAVVLPELRRCASRRFEIAVVPREREDALARRYGSNRWPTLLFLRDGAYVTTLSGMHDWGDYLQAVEAALAMPTGRAPTIGIPLVSAHAAGSACR
ncbi:hydrogenase [Pseudorhodoferax sp. Leaf267]|uniref:hydrogenase n=1 Tax=Pseudorhodoferax sp. Leaf267 TaxID=1736316 RepID=UPI0007022EAD|nr:hydrogenase [Pseudorhodoferax sp. Leaf267]KQP15007.1 hydrogenase [Pseudorhodoferax sp. Leaf267]